MWICSWLFLSWMIISGLYVIVVKKGEMTCESTHSTTTSDNVATSTTTCSTTSGVTHNLCIFVALMGVFTFALAIIPAVVGSNCVWYYC